MEEGVVQKKYITFGEIQYYKNSAAISEAISLTGKLTLTHHIHTYCIWIIHVSSEILRNKMQVPLHNAIV
jgi:hypothetical protein